MPEQLANDAISTLDSGINNSVTTLDVVDASLFPSTGNFRIRIDDELMLVTGVSTNTFTVERGAESTVAASHSAGATVTCVYTKGAVHAVLGDYNLYGPLSSLPAAGVAGRQYWTSDSFYQFYDTGSVWQAYYRNQKVVRPAALSNWSINNAGSATIDDYHGALRIRLEEPTPSNVFRSVTKTPPSTPFTIIAKIEHRVPNQVQVSTGLCFRRSGVTEWHAAIGVGGNSTININAFSNYSGFVDVTEQSIAYQCTDPPSWWKFADSGSARYLGYSFDGLEWRYLINNVSSGAYWTQGGNTSYDGVGFLTWSNGAGFGTAVLVSWEELNSVVL